MQLKVPSVTMEKNPVTTCCGGCAWWCSCLIIEVPLWIVIVLHRSEAMRQDCILVDGPFFSGSLRSQKVRVR